MLYDFGKFCTSAIARWSNLSPDTQAAITATPYYHEAMKVLKMKYENDPGAGKAAFEAIGDVAVGAIVGRNSWRCFRWRSTR